MRPCNGCEQDFRLYGEENSVNYELALIWGRTDAEATRELGTAVQVYCVRVIMSYEEGRTA